MPRTSGRPAAAALPLLLLLLPHALLLLASGQEVRLVAGPGCADLPPSPPTGLKAVPGDGNMTLSWSKPANGACVNQYEVTVVPVDGAAQRDAPARQQTPDFSVTIAGLQNGVNYKFFVRAFASKYRGGGEAQVVAAPAPACDPALLPSAPTGLRATPGVGNVTLCWGPPAVAGCVDEWRVAVQPVQTSGQRSGTATYLRYNKGGCVQINALTIGQRFNFSVQAWSASMRGGAYATVQATPLAAPRQWRCLPVPGMYPLCSSASSGMCAPLTCQQQFAKGQCSAPFMRIVDAPTMTIVQHCADLCGCSADPALGSAGPASRAAPVDMTAAAAAQPGTPRVQAMDGPFDSAAVRSAQSSASAGWASPSGCCANPPRSRAFAGIVPDDEQDSGDAAL